MAEKPTKPKSPRAGKELARFTTVWGKGKRAMKWNVIIQVCDDPVPDEQVMKDFAKIVAPILVKRIREEQAEKAKNMIKKE